MDIGQHAQAIACRYSARPDRSAAAAAIAQFAAMAGRLRHANRSTTPPGGRLVGLAGAGGHCRLQVAQPAPGGPPGLTRSRRAASSGEEAGDHWRA